MIFLNDMPDRTTPPAIQSVPFVFRKPTRLSLDNGIPVYTIASDGQNVVRVDFVFNAGQWQQTQKLQALFTCRMLREGCSGYSSSTFAERLDYYGAWLELSVAMNRTFVTLYTLKKFFKQTVELVQQMLFTPTFPEDQLRTICANNKAQFMVNLHKGDVVALRALRRSIYGESHPCGMQIEAKDYDALQISNLIDFFSRYYSSCNCSIYLSGNIDDKVICCVESLFGTVDWGSCVPIEEKQYTVSPAEEIRLDIVHPNAVQSSIRMGTLLMDVANEDYLPMRVLNTLLGGFFGSRLMKAIREEKGYTYHISSDLVTSTPKAMFMISCEALADKADEIIDEVRHEIYRLQTELVEEAELRMVRNYMTGEICRNYEGDFSLTDAYIFMEHMGLPHTHIEDTVNAVSTTDSAHLLQLAQQYLNPDKLHIVVVHP